jgi:antibiotic biosynthesis monooxygenase (ABM) superfamily enzyme
MTAAMTLDAARANQAVTVLVKRWPLRPCLVEWERTLSGAVASDLMFEGHLGATVLKPVGGDEYRVILRFRSRAAYEAWRRSAEAKSCFAVLASMERRAPEVVEAEGHAAWFDLPASPLHPAAPSKGKMALANWLGVYPTITVLVWALWPAMGDLPMAVRTLVLSGLMVPLLAWIVMPALIRLLRPWLFTIRETRERSASRI